jgi:hypothetical protein
MDEPVSQQEDLEDCTVTPAGVWECLDQVTRARVIELFARSAYDFVIAQREVIVEEDCDVYPGRDMEDHGGTP